MSDLKCSRRGSRVVVRSKYWQVEHDVRSGGCWRSIRFFKGSGKNLLEAPMSSRIRFFRLVPGTMYNDYASFEERFEKQPKITLGTTGAGDPVVTAEGTYTDRSGATIPVKYRRRCEYREWGLVATDLEILPQGECPGVVEVNAAELCLRPGMTHAYVRPHPVASGNSDLLGLGDWMPLKPGICAYSHRYVPMHVVCFEKGVEGIDLFPSSDLNTWDTGVCGEIGRGLYSVATDGTGVTTVGLNPYCMAFRRIEVTLKTPIRFRLYWGLAFVRDVEETASVWFHAGTWSDWASDGELEQLASAGVKLIRFHCDYQEKLPFWHDGTYPPFDERGMKQLRRIIDTSHRLGMKIVPYVSLKEFHPESPGYVENAEAWTQKPSAGVSGIHTHIHSGEFGRVMCMESPWLEFRKRACDIMLDDLSWDGLYFDWCCPHGCTHPDHLPGAFHTDTDGFLDFLFYCRRRIGPGGTLVLHLSGLPYVVAENMADLALIYEDTQSFIPLPGEFLPQCDFIPVVQRHLVMNIGNDAVKTRKFIMGGMLQGHPAITSMPTSAFTEAVLVEMGLFGREDLSRYRFLKASNRPVETGRDEVYAALWYDKGRVLVYLGNFSDRSARGAFRMESHFLGTDAARRKALVRRLGIMGRGATARPQTAASLRTKGVAYTLKPWGSALYRIEG